MARVQKQPTANSRPARRPKAAERAWPAPIPSQAELAGAFSQALDLAEGRQPGHAARVCYIALGLGEAVGLSPEQLRAVYYASLLHDAGAAPATAELCRVLNLSEETLFGGPPGRSAHQLAMEVAPASATHVVEALHRHPQRGAQVAKALRLEAAVEEAIESHHERWDGHGYPRALKGEETPVTARLVAAADLIESLIATDDNPLTARRNLIADLAVYTGSVIDPTLAEQARALARSDDFWLGLHNDTLPQELPSSCPPGPAEERSPADLLAFAEVFAALADSKGEHTAGHSQRTAGIAEQLAHRLGFTEGRREMLRVAAMLRDVGHLGVPARTIAKPDILSLQEMEIMRKHPVYSQMVLSSLAGMAEVAHWVGAHHERPDGRGYPETLEADAIPLESRIIALADTYVALTSQRPYRRALSPEDAEQVLVGGAGAQLDRKLVQLLCAQLPDVTSSRAARRSAQRR